MRKTLVLAALLFFSSQTFAQTILRMVNNTDKKIWTSYVIYSKADGFTSRGWYVIDRYSERNFDLGNFRGNVYIHGRTGNLFSKKTWGVGYNFCIDENNSFRITQSDKGRCKDRAGFSIFNVRRGTNTWTFSR